MDTPSEGVTIAGRYRLARKLGAGGMGTVWLAHDLSLDSACAIKLVDRARAFNLEVKMRFEREAKTAAQLRGSHVVDVFEHGAWDGVPFIVMEFLDGEDLSTRLERSGSLDVRATYEIVAQVARALVRAHGLGIVHRDLKPENIFLVPGDEHEIAKVLDFGIAKHDAYSIAGTTTKTGSFMGTPYYASPEQARGKDIDWRSDLWSLGVIIYQCLVGHPPFESDALGELMGMILYEPVPPLRVENQPLPAALSAWWERAMSRDRELRFQSAKELVDAFADAAGIHKLAVPSIVPRSRSISLPEPDLSHSVPPVTLSAPELERRSSGEITIRKIPRERLNSAHRPTSGAEAAAFDRKLFRASVPRRTRLIAISASMISVILFVLIWSAMRIEGTSSSALATPLALTIASKPPPKSLQLAAQEKPVVSPLRVMPKPPEVASSAKLPEVASSAKLPDMAPSATARPIGKPATPKSKPLRRTKPVRDAVPDYGI